MSYTPYTLRPYQVDSVAAGLEFLTDPAETENGIIVAPTGSGKSLIIAKIATQLDSPCLVFQPSKEILEQNLEKFLSYGYSPAIYSASLNRKQIGQITLATIGSVMSHSNQEQRQELFSKFKYVIQDECHMTNSKGGLYTEFFESMNCRVLGFTATPYRLVTDGYGGSILKFLTRTRPRVFNKVVQAIQIPELFHYGYLCPLEYKVVDAIRPERLTLNSTGADFTDDSVKRHYKEISFHDLVVKCVERLWYYNRKHALVFTRFTDEAAYVASKVPGSEVVTSKTSDRRRREIIRAFKRGHIRCVCNVGVLTHGFDFPELDSVVLARPTLSLNLYYQQVGRGIRPHPSKKNAFIVDMASLVKQFGRIEHMTLRSGPNDTWYYTGSGGKELTNVYYGKRFGYQQSQIQQPKQSLFNLS